MFFYRILDVDLQVINSFIELGVGLHKLHLRGLLLLLLRGVQ
jgi:hypothetical protein